MSDIRYVPLPNIISNLLQLPELLLDLFFSKRGRRQLGKSIFGTGQPREEGFLRFAVFTAMFLYKQHNIQINKYNENMVDAILPLCLCYESLVIS